jgi:hypothetical protein
VAINPADLVTGWRRELIDRVAALLHADKALAAGKFLAGESGVPPPKSIEDARKECWTLVGWCLGNGHYADAATLLWPRSIFTPEPECTRLVWGNIGANVSTMLQGASSVSKTFSAGVYFLLDWLADPEFTTVRVVGPTQSHLSDNLFSHLVDMHTRASLPMPGEVGDLWIGANRRNRRAGIVGVIIPMGRSASGRLQGVKRFPRTTPHPKWCPMSRLRVLMDEVEHIPVGVWSDVENLAANVDDYQGLKIAVAYNPKNPAGACGVRAEPPEGWGNLAEDKLTWVSKRGWSVVRLDAERSENVIQGRVIYPGLQTKEGLEKLALESGGRDSPGYYTFGRAMFPREGGTFSVISAGSTITFQGDFIWEGKPRRVGACDLALTGGDKSTFAYGLFGMATGFTSYGRRTDFRASTGKLVARTVLWIEGLVALPRGDSVAMAASVRRTCIELGIHPGWLMLDRTGHGQGVFDILINSWSPEVRGVNYSETATRAKILFEDSDTCDIRYDRVVSELVFATKAWMEHDLLKHSGVIPHDPLYAQLTGRRYDPKLRAKVESKQDYKHRLSLGSPDEADAVTLLVHCVRIAGSCVPAGLVDNVGDESADDERPMAFNSDATNLVDSMD